MAKEMYEKAAAINHKMYGANYNLGLIAFIQRDFDTAEKFFENSLYGDLEAMSYYQLAKIYVHKGDKDKAINFLNKAIELDPSLLKVAEKEKTFEKIKEYITVSVKMDEQEISDEDIEEEKEVKRSEVLIAQENESRKYLEETLKLIDEMSESASKQRIDEKLNYIFNKEKDKKEQENIELNDIEKEIKNLDKELTKEQKQKELGTN